MECQKCLKEMPDELAAKVREGATIHCPYCTAQLEEREPLLDVDSHGIWYVETEQSVDGKGRRRLGVVEGPLADVIARYAPYKEYSLYIRKLSPKSLDGRGIERPDKLVSVHLEGRGGESNERLLRSYLSGDRVSVDGTHVEWVG